MFLMDAADAAKLDVAETDARAITAADDAGRAATQGVLLADEKQDFRIVQGLIDSNGCGGHGAVVVLSEPGIEARQRFDGAPFHPLFSLHGIKLQMVLFVTANARRAHPVGGRQFDNQRLALLVQRQGMNLQ